MQLSKLKWAQTSILEGLAGCPEDTRPRAQELKLWE